MALSIYAMLQIFMTVFGPLYKFHYYCHKIECYFYETNHRKPTGDCIIKHFTRIFNCNEYVVSLCACPSNLKWLAIAKTPAYHSKEFITALKSIMIQSLDVDHFTLLHSMI